MSTIKTVLGTWGEGAGISTRFALRPADGDLDTGMETPVPEESPAPGCLSAGRLEHPARSAASPLPCLPSAHALRPGTLHTAGTAAPRPAGLGVIYTLLGPGKSLSQVSVPKAAQPGTAACQPRPGDCFCPGWCVPSSAAGEVTGGKDAGCTPAAQAPMPALSHHVYSSLGGREIPPTL